MRLSVHCEAHTIVTSLCVALSLRSHHAAENVGWGGLGSSRRWQLSVHYWSDELCRVLRDTPTALARLAMRTLLLYNTKTDDEGLGALGTVWCTASRTRKLIRCTSDCCNMGLPSPGIIILAAACCIQPTE